MSALVLILVIFAIGLTVMYFEERGEDRRINKMVRDDIKARRKRGDIVKEVRSRG